MKLFTPKIETKRLILRPFTVADAPAMYRNWASDPETVRFMTFPPYESEEDAADYLARSMTYYEKEDACLWAITLKDSGEVIGSLGVFPHRNEVVRCVKVGYIIGKPWWHKGIVPEALAAVIHFLFTETEVNRIEAQHDIRNPNSGAVMRKCGMRHEGTIRASDRNNLGIADMAQYGILKEDYL